jgi:peptidoglycan/xylan/chitin deacetylase (PgdA/CDA1 family)
MLRPVMKSAVAGAMSLTRLDRIGRVPFAVTYHRTVERLGTGNGLSLPSMEISVAMLEKHLDWLGQHFRIVPPEEFAEKFHERGRSRPLATVTFDDGYSDVFHHAFPLLKRKGVPAGIFVITDLIGSTQPPVHECLHALLIGVSRTSTGMRMSDLLCELNLVPTVRQRAEKMTFDPFSMTQFVLRNLTMADVQRVMDRLQSEKNVAAASPAELQPLSWEMLAEMRDAGMTVGSHSKRHPFLTNESKPLALEEAVGSRRKLQEKLGVEAACFAYPCGGFNASVVDDVATAGYRYGFTICGHRDARFPMLTIPRTGLWEQACLDPFGQFSPSIMSCQASGVFSPRCTEPHLQEQASGSGGVALSVVDPV